MSTLEFTEKCFNFLDQQRKLEIPSKYDLERLKECVAALFTYAKFRVGDTVKIAKDYPISKEENWGWLSYRHLFKKGKKAKILKVDWYNNGFQYEIQFFENSWIDDKGTVTKVQGTNYVVFYISEEWLKK